MVYAKQMGNAGVIRRLHFAAVLPDRLGPTGHISRLIRVVLVVNYVENASEETQIRWD